MSGVPAEIRMGNDIARQFGHVDPDVAVARIADHLDRFWEARMITALRALVAAGAPDADPLLVRAVEQLPGADPS